MNTLMLVHCLGQNTANWCQLSSVLKTLNVVVEILNHYQQDRAFFSFPAAFPSLIFQMNCNGNAESGFLLVSVAGMGIEQISVL